MVQSGRAGGVCAWQRRLWKKGWYEQEKGKDFFGTEAAITVHSHFNICVISNQSLSAIPDKRDFTVPGWHGSFQMDHAKGKYL